MVKESKFIYHYCRYTVLVLFAIRLCVRELMWYWPLVTLLSMVH